MEHDISLDGMTTWKYEKETQKANSIFLLVWTLANSVTCSEVNTIMSILMIDLFHLHTNQAEG